MMSSEELDKLRAKFCDKLHEVKYIPPGDNQFYCGRLIEQQLAPPIGITPTYFE